MTFSHSHKTVFVLDHSGDYAQSSNYVLEFDKLSKANTPGFIPVAPVSKSLWTCAVEAAIEYCRICWDIYPEGKLVRFIASDTEARVLNTWSRVSQTTNHIMSSLAYMGGPDVKIKGSSILHGLKTAIKVMCEKSPQQEEKEEETQVVNRGRIICITTFTSEESLKQVEDYFVRILYENNKKTAHSSTLLSINHLELCFINSYPNNHECYIKETPRRDLNAYCSSSVHCVKAGRYLATKMYSLVLNHYELASTTVTGIPMKEEQNASASCNYDVELFHPAIVHKSFLTEDVDTSSFVSRVEGVEYNTITLKWCTPRNSGHDAQLFCAHAQRVTTVDVNSRPSSCLCNFLLNGRTVMLEMVKQPEGKVMSHMLAAHGGEIFIHSLVQGRSVLEDPPSISEGLGGRVTDYRISDFGELMKENLLAPKKDGILNQGLERAKERLDRFTKYWPMTISESPMYSFAGQVENLPQLIVKEHLTEADLLKCKQVLFDLMRLELNPSNNKGPKREEQFKALWAEIEKMIRAHCRSEAHKKVLECFLELRRKDDDSNEKSGRSSAKEKAETHSKSSQPPAKKSRLSDHAGGKVNLLTLWNQMVGHQNGKKRPEMAGRVEKNFELYQNLEERR